MNSNISKITMFEGICLITTVMLNNIVLSVPKDIIKHTASAAWLNALMLSILAVVFIVVICKLFKNFPYMDIIDVSNFLGGKPLKYIIGISFVVMLIITISTSLRLFSDVLQIIFLNHTPIIFIIAFFLFGAIIANKLGLRAISKAASITVVFVLIGFAILVISLSEYYNIYNLFPALGYGPVATFLQGLTNIYAFGGLCILYFMKPFLSDEKHFSKIAIISAIIAGILLVVSILNQILMFGVMFDSEVIIGLVLSSRILNFGNFFQRVDGLFTFLWIFTQLAYLSIATYLVLYILRKITNSSNQNGMLYSIIMIIFGICIIPQNTIVISNTLINFSNVLKTVLVFIVVPIVLVIANLKFKGKYLKKNGGSDG